MSSTLSIQNARQKSLKSLLKEYVGQSVATISRNRTKELFDAPISQPSGFRDKAIMAFLKRRAVLKNQEEFFERLHLDFWQGEGGEVFSSNCDHRFGELFLDKQKVDFEMLRAMWFAKKPEHIVEFGCNSGLLIDYLTRNLPGVVTSTGIDINSKQIEQNKSADKFDSRIQFECSEGGEWLLENGNSNTLYVSNGGVLEYFRRERLNTMLTHISKNLGPSMFFAIEPVATDHNWRVSKESVPFGNELSFSHNYTDLFESNGFDIQHQRSVKFESWNMVATLAIAN